MVHKNQKAGEQKRKRKVTLDTLNRSGKNMGYKTAFGCAVYLYQRHEYYVNDAGDVLTANSYHDQVSRLSAEGMHGVADKIATKEQSEVVDYNPFRHYLLMKGYEPISDCQYNSLRGCICVINGTDINPKDFSGTNVSEQCGTTTVWLNPEHPRHIEFMEIASRKCKHRKEDEAITEVVN